MSALLNFYLPCKLTSDPIKNFNVKLHFDVFDHFLILSEFLIGHSRPLFSLFFVFSTVYSNFVHYKILKMTQLEPKTSDI